MAGHVDFGDYGHAAFGCVVLDFFSVGLGVEHSGIAGDGGVACELRVGFDFETPSGDVGEVPVECVDFESGEEVDFALEFIDGEE